MSVRLPGRGFGVFCLCCCHTVQIIYHIGPRYQDHVMTWTYFRLYMMTASNRFSALLALCAGNSPVTGEFPSQRPVTRSLMFSLSCAWMNDWINNREAGDLRRHYDVILWILPWAAKDRRISITGVSNVDLWGFLCYTLDHTFDKQSSPGGVGQIHAHMGSLLWWIMFIVHVSFRCFVVWYCLIYPFLPRLLHCSRAIIRLVVPKCH